MRVRSADPDGTDAAVAGALPPQALAQGLASAGVPFIANHGQLAHENVLFYARLFAGTVFVTDRNELVYALPQHSRAARGSERAAPVWAFRERFSHDRPTRPRGASPSAVRVGHYKGHDPQRWMDRLAVWDSLGLGEPYPGIRVTLRAAGNNV